MKRAIRQHSRDFVALLVLFVIALGVSAFILGNERLYLPSWVPGVGKSFYTVNAEFSTAQAVVPGQGQTVDIAGVPIGEIGSVNLKDGVAVVQLKIKQKYKPIYRDARMLLRPKTGLKDMIVEMDPGNRSAGALPDGGTIPVASTSPDVNLDEVLSSLDTDTRSYLQVLIGAGGQAFSGRGYTSDLRQTFKRFQPTNRDLARITGLLSQRRQNLKHVIHNFALLSQTLGQRDTQISQFVDSANANFRALANQDANIRQSLQLLPDTLSTARTTLNKASAFAGQLGPTLQQLRPFARALGPSLAQTQPFLRDTTPVIKNQLRPFAVQVQPPVRELKVVAKNLLPLTPHLTNTFKVVNSLLNELTYNPPGPEEGYLFWASWLNHAAATIFSTQDANGPVRRGMILVSCQSLQLLEQITSQNPSLDVLFQLLHSPTSKQVCPQAVPPAKRAAKPRKAAPAPPAAKPAPVAPAATPGKPVAPPPTAASPSANGGHG